MESDGFAVQFCANKLCPRRECGRKREVYLFSGVLELQSDLVGGAPKTKLDRAVRDMQIADREVIPVRWNVGSKCEPMINGVSIDSEHSSQNWTDHHCC